MKNNTESSELNTSKHKVLLFGWNLVHHLGTSIYYHKNADIDIIPFPEDYGYLKRLSEYTLVITDYAPFNTIRGLHAEEQDVFEKMCSEALDKGTTICFVH